MEESGVRLVVENAGSYFSALAKASDATNDLNEAALEAASGVADFGNAADKIKLQQLNNQLADQKNRLTALGAELERQGKAYDFASNRALSTAASYQRVNGQIDVTQAKIAQLVAAINTVPEIPAPAPPKPINVPTVNLGGAVRDLTQFDAAADAATNSLKLMERELDDLKSTYAANTTRIKDLREAIRLTSASTEQDEKASASLNKELERLISTNNRLAPAIDKRTVALQKATAKAQPKIESPKVDLPKIEAPDLKTDKQESAIKDLIGSIGGLAGAYVSLGAVASFAFEGLTLGAELEQSKFAIQTLTGSVEKGNAIYNEAIKFGQKYGYTQQEMASAAAAAAGIFNKTNQSTEKTLEVLGRLAALNPAEGFEGAVVAFKELASGDITSIAERFNIARSEANAMKDAIAGGADPVKVLDAALSKMNVTSEVLANRMRGTNGSLLQVKLGFEDLKLAAGGFLESIGAPEMLSNFASGLSFLATGLKVVSGNTTELTNALVDLQVRGFAIGNYDLYVQKMTEAGLADEILSREAYAAAQAMIAKGTAANDVSAGISNLVDAEAVLRDMLFQQVNAGQLSEEKMGTLIQRTLELAATNPTVSASLLDIVTAMNDSGEGADELTQYLDALSINQEFAASTAYGYADAQQAAYDATIQQTDGVDTTTAAVYELTDAEYKSAEAKLNNALESERAAQLEQDLAIAYDMAAQGAVGQVAAISYLMNAYGLEASEVSRLINLHNELIKARGGTLGNAAAGALQGAVNYNQGRRAGRITAPYTPSSGRGGRSGGGAGKGKKAGKSEEEKQAEKNEKALKKIEDRITDAHEKYLKKKEQLDRDHVARLAKIEADYQKKSLEAEKKFNTDKFNVRNSFKGSILDIDKDLWDAARAEEVGYWNESQAIAQAGDAQRAEDFYAAAQEYAALKAQHAQELRDLDAQIAGSTDEAEQAELAERKRRLQEYYTEQEMLAKEGLDKLRNGENELTKERDEAITEENSRYVEANNELEQNFKDTVTELIEDSDELQSAVVDMVSALIPSFASLAQAARDAANAARSIPSADTSTDKSIMPVESRAGGGTVQRNRAYLVGDKPGGRPTQWSEVFVPKQSGSILPRQQTQAMLEPRPRALPASPQQQLQRQESRAIAMNTVKNYNLTTITNQSPRVVQQSFAQMEAMGK